MGKGISTAKGSGRFAAMTEADSPVHNEILTQFDKDWEIWDKSKTESFLYINDRSCPFPHWLSYEQVRLSGKYSGSILQPVNDYVSHLYPAPAIVEDSGNKIVLRQGNHAEMFLLIKDNGSFYNIDRPWIRQYYPSDMQHELPSDCFEGIYRFYIPWVLDEDLEVKVKQVVGSPFHIYEDTIKFKKIDSSSRRIDPQFVYFHFKSAGPHMIQDGFGKIKRQSPMFDIEINTDDIMLLSRVRKFYE